MINKIKQWFSLAWAYITDKKNYKVLKAVHSIADEVAKKTKNDIDNAALAFIVTAFRYETRTLSFKNLKEVSELINKLTKGPLSDYEVSINKHNNITLKSPIGTIIYDYSKGTLRWTENI